MRPFFGAIAACVLASGAAHSQTVTCWDVQGVMLNHPIWSPEYDGFGGQTVTFGNVLAGNATVEWSSGIYEEPARVLMQGSVVLLMLYEQAIITYTLEVPFGNVLITRTATGNPIVPNRVSAYRGVCRAG